MDPDEQEWLAEWEQADAEAVAILREALADVRGQGPPVDALGPAAAGVRAGLAAGAWPLDWVGRAAGLDAPIDSDADLILEVVAAAVSPADDPGLDPQEEALLMALQHADWLGAVIGLVRAGPGASAEAEGIADVIDACPDIDGPMEPGDRSLVAAAFSLIVPTWEAAGIVDSTHSITHLGVWALPRGAAWAWDGELD